MTLVRWLLVLLLFWSQPAIAQVPQWSVTEVRGAAQLQRGGTVQPLRRGLRLIGGDAVQTGANGRAVLARGREFVVIAPSSRLRIPASSAQDPGIIQVLQDVGRAVFRIERRATPHFGVRTPHLAALVRGTVFTVSVDDSGSRVTVTEGRVEVGTGDGRSSQLLDPGMQATVRSGAADRIEVGRVSSDAGSGGDDADGISGAGGSGGDGHIGDEDGGGESDDRAPAVDTGGVAAPGRMRLDYAAVLDADLLGTILTSGSPTGGAPGPLQPGGPALAVPAPAPAATLPAGLEGAQGPLTPEPAPVPIPFPLPLNPALDPPAVPPPSAPDPALPAPAPDPLPPLPAPAPVPVPVPPVPDPVPLPPAPDPVPPPPAPAPDPVPLPPAPAPDPVPPPPAPDPVPPPPAPAPPPPPPQPPRLCLLVICL